MQEHDLTPCSDTKTDAERKEDDPKQSNLILEYSKFKQNKISLAGGSRRSK